MVDHFMEQVRELEDDAGVHYIAGANHNVVCKYCHVGGFRWHETKHGWRLFDKSKQLHKCEKYEPDPFAFTPRRVVRRAEVQRIRAEGAQAYRDGKSIEQNPHQYMDKYQWMRGYMEAKNGKP